MPAITPNDLFSLPRVAPPRPAVRERAVVSVTAAPHGLEGEGFPVRRAFGGVDLALLDPFVHLDEMGEVDYAPGEAKGTAWHPHRGFETVTYMLDGILHHRDSEGGGGVIADGDTQWMTAGAGILHIEAPPEHLVASGGRFHGFQLWVNLPAANKFLPPGYQDLTADRVTLLTTPDAGVLLRLIAGDLDGARGPGITHTPITMLHATLAPGAEMRLPWSRKLNALVYVLAGRARLGTERWPATAGHLGVFGPGDALRVAAESRQEPDRPAVDVLVLGGVPLREPIAWAGPFVMNTRDQLVQAFEDYRAGRLGRIPATAAPGAPLDDDSP